LINPGIIVRQTPEGIPSETDFELVDAAEPGAEGVLCETLYISVDPYLRGRLSGRHLTDAIKPGSFMESELILRTENGEIVRGFGGWQTRQRLPQTSLTPVPDRCNPPSLALGVLGMPGLTAYAGVTRLLKPQPGETLLVSAAAGAVGATVGQLAARAGTRVVGIAGSEEKCAWLADAAGFDATINYKQQDLREGIASTCPDGIDLYFDNVGGDVLNAALEALRPGARVVLCGLMEQYNLNEPPTGPNPGLIIRARATVYGLVVYDHEDLRDEMLNALTPLLPGGEGLNGEIAYKESLWHGIDQAPAAFCGLMRGENFGKVIVKVGE